MRQAPRICFWGAHTDWPWMVACGRYTFSVPPGAEFYTTRVVTRDPREVTCRCCWRTRRWREAMGLRGRKVFRVLRVKSALSRYQTAR